MRLAQGDALATIPAREVPQSTWFANIRQSFGVLTRPQWALAAAALLVLGISVPLFLTLSRNQDSPLVATQITASRPEAATTQANPSTLASAKPQREADESVPAQETKHREKALDKFDAKSEVHAENMKPAANDAPGTAGKAGLVASAELSKKQEAGAVAQEEQRTKSENQVAQSQAQAPSSAPATQVARNEAQQARQQQPTDKDLAQQVAEPKPRAAQESTDKEKSKRADEAEAAPAPPASTDAARGGSRRPPSKLALRDPKTGETVKVEERKSNGKHFFFTGGAWTDKDYDPNKDLPTVTVIRDSNVYKELLTKRNGLKSIMALFTASERAIIVYKGTVYKLIPQ